MTGEETTPERVAPPWLWFWLALYAYSLPRTIVQWRASVAVLATSWGTTSTGADIPGTLYEMAGILEMLPQLLLLLGVLTILFPHVRAWQISRRFHLDEPPADLPVMAEIVDYVWKSAPELGIRANLYRTDVTAFIYPVRYRKAAIAIFGGLVKLWRSDRAAAESVLEHEIAHHRQGDTLVLGAGSLFEGILRHWGAIFTVTIALPILAAWVLLTFRLWDEIGALRELGVPVTGSALLLHKLTQLFGQTLPGVLLLLIALLFMTFAAILLPLAGIWYAELCADRAAVLSRQASTDLARALAVRGPALSATQWIFSSLSHPPLCLRRWFTQHARQPGTELTLLLLFPAAYLARLVVLLAWAMSIQYFSGFEWLDIIQSLRANSIVYWQTVAPVFWAQAVLLLIWPLAAGVWEALVRGAGFRSRTGDVKPYVAAALIVGLFGAVAIL